MLVPLDGSELAEIALRCAEELAATLCLDVACLHVYGTGEDELSPMHRAYVERVAASVSDRIHDFQLLAGISCARKTVRAQGVLATGHPAEEILRYAEENDIGLIVMSTHGRSGFGRWVLGSVADKVMRASDVPVLLARAGAVAEVMWGELSPRTLVVPLDGSELAELALPHVNELAVESRAEFTDVVLLRVCDAPDVLADYPESTMRRTWREHLEEAQARSKQGAMEYLARVQNRLSKAGLKVRSEVEIGSAAEMIVQCANKEKSSLVVMTTHGRSGLSRLAYGSVASRVVNESSSPIFLVPPPRPAVHR